MEQRLFEQDFDFEIFYTDNTVFLGSDVLLEEYEIIDVFKICYEVFPRAKLYRLVIQPNGSEKAYFYELSANDMRRYAEGRISMEEVIQAMKIYVR